MIIGQFWALGFVALWVWESAVAFRWTSHYTDGVVKYVCSGQHLFLPWKFSLDNGQAVAAIEWAFHGRSDEVVGMTDRSGRFAAMASFGNRVQFIPSAGIILKNVVPSDSGNYSVKIVSESGANSFGEQHMTTVVVVAEPPASDNNKLSASLERSAVYDNHTDDWSVQLSCGHFRTAGNPPVEVVWTTPSGQTAPSSGYQGGKFLLTLDNPVKGGNYTCYIVPSSPAAACLTGSARLLQQVDADVDEMGARLTLIEARQGYIKAESAQLKQQNSQITSQLTSQAQQNSQLTSQLHQQQAVDANLTSYIHDLEAAQANLTSHVHDLEVTETNLTSYIHDLEDAQTNLTSQIHQQTSQLTSQIHQQQAVDANLTSYVYDLEGAQANLTTNVHDLEAEHTNLTSQLHQQQAVDANLTSYIHDLEAAQANLTSHVHDLEVTEANLTSYIHDLEAAQTNFKSQIHQQQTVDANLTSYIHDLEAAQANFTSDVHDLEAAQTNFTSHIQQQNAQLTSQLHQQQAADANLTSYIHDLEAAQASFTSHVQGLQVADTSLTSRIQHLEVADTSLTSRIQHLEVAEGNLTSHIHGLEASGPCAAGNHMVLSDPWRDVNRRVRNEANHHDDDLVQGWYRFVINGTNAVMPTLCWPYQNGCSTERPIYIANTYTQPLGDGWLPQPGQEASGIACAKDNNQCCAYQRTPVTVRNCGTYSVYYLYPTNQYGRSAYCSVLP